MTLLYHEPPGGNGQRRTAQVAFLLGFIAAGALRAWPRSALWLDEAQSVSFARLPLSELPSALRQDGAPPLYYALLHLWIRAFGDGDAAVRMLSVVCSLGALVVLTVAANRIFDAAAARATFVIMAISPFAIRYGSEARMYALVTLEVSVGILLVHRVFTRPSRNSSAAVSLLTAALLYTHYWTLYLLAAFGAVLTFQSLRGADSGHRRIARRTTLAVGLGALLWLPWLPNFLFQSEHTGTPWARRVSPGAVLDSIGFRFSGAGWSIPIYAVLITTAIIAAFQLRQEATSAPRRVWTVALAIVLIGSAALSVAGSALSDSAFASRYTSAMFPLAILIAGVGVSRLRPAGAAGPLVLFIVVLGAVLSIREIHTERTMASSLVQLVDASAGPDDVIVYCPDQLGPAFSRLLARQSERLAEWPYPGASSPRLVDWIDYEKRYDSASASNFIEQLDAAHRSSTIWLVVSLTYPPTQPACTQLLVDMYADRPAQLLRGDDPSIADHAALWRFLPAH